MVAEALAGAQGLVGPQMQALREAHLRGDGFDRSESANRVGLPSLTAPKDIRPHLHTDRISMGSDPFDVFRPDVDGLVEDRDGVDLRDRAECRAQIGLIALGIRRRHGDEDGDAGFACRPQRRQPLRGRRSVRFINAGQVVSQGGQAHTEHQARGTRGTVHKGPEEIEIPPGQRAPRQDSDVERRPITDQFQGTPDEEPRVLGEFPSPLCVRVMDHLIRVRCGAEHDRAIAVWFQALDRRSFRGPEGSQEALFVPRAKQHIIAPLAVRIRHTVLCQLGSLLDCRRARNVAEPAGVRAADGDVERPIREALEDEIVRCDYGRGGPHPDPTIEVG
jgi:hypothetical protein